jgi:NDP-sugar pyrophosphorylase family protein
MFAGSHCISSRIFRHLPDEEEFGIVDRVYQPLLESGEESLAGVVDDGLWFDIGTLQRYVSASRGMREAMVRGQIAAPAGSHVDGDSLVHDTARADVAASIVGARSRVSGAVRDSIIWDDCSVDASLERCIVTHGAAVTGEHRDALITTEGVFRL